MSRFAQAACAILACCWLLPGCAHRACCPGGNAHSTHGVNATSIEVPHVPEGVRDRGVIHPDLSILKEQAEPSATPQLVPPGERAPAEYRQVDARQCQCLAARHSLLGNLLVAESSLATQTSGSRRSAAEAPVRRDVLAYRSIDERNRSAAAALRLFYGLAEAEANRDLLDASLKETDRAVANFEKLKAAGMPLKADESVLRRQKLALLDQQTQLLLSIEKLNAELCGLIGVDPSDEPPLWPEADLTVTAETVDVEAAVAEGLRNRADLAMLRLLQESLEVDTLGAVRGGLQGIDSMLGSSAASRRLFGRGRNDACTETHTRREQVGQLNDQRQASAAAEIRQAAHTVAARLRQVELAKGQRDSRKQQLDRIRQKREADGLTAFDISAAKLELLKAESELVRQVIAWRVAQVELKQAQGLLAAECGYRP